MRTCPTALAWSGGKDSSLALAALRDDPTVEVVALVTTITQMTAAPAPSCESSGQVGSISSVRKRLGRNPDGCQEKGVDVVRQLS